MKKEIVINNICKLLKRYFCDFDLPSVEVANIYHEKIDEIFCSKYNIDAPLSTYQKNGPHIYIKIKNLIGFGIYCEKINFNNGLYDEGKFWAEITNSDFIMLFSENIKDEDFANRLFQNNLEILLQGFKPSKDKTKIIPIYIVKLEDNANNLNVKYYKEDMLSFLNKSQRKENIINKDKIKISASDCYIIGNTYNDIGRLSNKGASIVFNNRVIINGVKNPARIKLKLFNNIRDLERKLKLDYDTKYKIDISKSGEYKIDSINLHIDFTQDEINRIKKIKIEDIIKMPPLYIKYFLKGFIDANFMYSDVDYYSGSACFDINDVDTQIKKTFELVGSKIQNNKIINIDNSFLEVRRSPFIKNNIDLI